MVMIMSLLPSLVTMDGASIQNAIRIMIKIFQVQQNLDWHNIIIVEIS